MSKPTGELIQNNIHPSSDFNSAKTSSQSWLREVLMWMLMLSKHLPDAKPYIGMDRKNGTTNKSHNGVKGHWATCMHPDSTCCHLPHFSDFLININVSIVPSICLWHDYKRQTVRRTSIIRKNSFKSFTLKPKLLFKSVVFPNVIISTSCNTKINLLRYLSMNL